MKTISEAEKATATASSGIIQLADAYITDVNHAYSVWSGWHIKGGGQPESETIIHFMEGAVRKFSLYVEYELTLGDLARIILPHRSEIKKMSAKEFERWLNNEIK